VGNLSVAEGRMIRKAAVLLGSIVKGKYLEYQQCYKITLNITPKRKTPNRYY